MSPRHSSKQHSKSELILWGIAFPGFGQILNGHYIKALLFIFLEFLINVNGNFNRIIMLSFNGETILAAELANFEWLMFYPCIYFFAIWDAYKESAGRHYVYDFFPFVSSAYFVTLGVIFSKSFTLFGMFPGPVLLPMLFLLPGLATGMLLKVLFNKKYTDPS